MLRVKGLVGRPFSVVSEDAGDVCYDSAKVSAGKL